MSFIFVDINKKSGKIKKVIEKNIGK